LFVPDGDKVVVEDNEGQEVQDKVGALAVDVIMGPFIYIKECS
jgi:hypothetical protein